MGRKIRTSVCWYLAIIIAFSSNSVGAQLIVPTVTSDFFHTQQEYKMYLQLIEKVSCPVCKGQKLSESNVPIAMSIKHQVAKLVKTGQSSEQILTTIEQGYGEKVGSSDNTYLTVLSIFFVVIFLATTVTFVHKRLKVRN